MKWQSRKATVSAELLSKSGIYYKSGISYSQLRPWLIQKGRIKREGERLGVNIGESTFIELNEQLYALVGRIAERLRAEGRKTVRPEDIGSAGVTPPSHLAGEEGGSVQ